MELAQTKCNAQDQDTETGEQNTIGHDDDSLPCHEKTNWPVQGTHLRGYRGFSIGSPRTQ